MCGKLQTDLDEGATAAGSESLSLLMVAFVPLVPAGPCRSTEFFLVSYSVMSWIFYPLASDSWTQVDTGGPVMDLAHFSVKENLDYLWLTRDFLLHCI